MTEDMIARPLKVFLCHAHEDEKTVRALYLYLMRYGVNAWLDKVKLLPGQDWAVEIRRAVEKSDVVVVCLSKIFNQEGFRQKEVRLALETADIKPEGTIFLIPVRLEECDSPESLKRWHWVDLYDKDGYRKLRLALETRAKEIGALPPNMLSGKTQTNLERATGKKTGSVQTEPISEKRKADEVQPVAPKKEESPKLETPKEKTPGAADVWKYDSNITFVAGNGDGTKNTAGEKSASSSSHSSAAPRPIQGQKPQAKKPTRKMSTPVLVALIGALATICAAVLGSLPWNEWLVPSPTPTITFTAELPTNTQTPTLTPVSTLTPTITPTPILGVGSMWTSPKDGMVMMYVPAGEFSMGSEGGSDDEKPIHRVSLDSYWMDQTEVTNAMYAKCVREGVCNQPSRTDYYSDPAYAEHPVVNVSWNDAASYCEWRGDGTRLPTEAEWEKAAGWDDDKKEKRVYPWGNTLVGSLLNFCDKNCSYAWADKNVDDGYEFTAPVGHYPDGASFYGLLDMAGNVCELVADWYDLNSYGSSPSSNPQGPPTGDYRMLRGGSWFSLNNYQRSSARLGGSPGDTFDDVGFRCARSQ